MGSKYVPSIGIKLENFEMSRASKVYHINNKIPETCLNLLKTDDERRERVIEYQNSKQ